MILVTATGAVLLLPWIGYLSVSLPRSHSVRAWDVLWVGFDIVLACCFALTDWLIVQRRQLAMFGLVVVATLLVLRRVTVRRVPVAEHRGTTVDEYAAAVLVELPVAFLLATSAVRILRRTLAITQLLQGHGASPISLWQQRFVMLPPTED